MLYALSLVGSLALICGGVNAAGQTTPRAHTPLEGSHWTLTELEGQPVAPSTGAHAAYLQLIAEGKRVAGSSGCNRLIGTYDKTGSDLKFHPIATTMMACSGPLMEQENKLNHALNATRRYRIKGNTLVLFDGKTTVAKFKAQAEDQQGSNP